MRELPSECMHLRARSADTLTPTMLPVTLMTPTTSSCSAKTLPMDRISPRNPLSPGLRTPSSPRRLPFSGRSLDHIERPASNP